jgi:LytR cell envelope-related transcriptional attenuator
MKSLTGSHMTFITAQVITTNGQIDGQDVNLISPAAIKKEVRRTFYPPPSKGSAPKTKPSKVPSLSPGQTTVDVLNGGAPVGMAGEMSHALTAAGYLKGKVANTTAQTNTQVLYGAGAEASAQKIAGAFEGISATASSSVAAGHVELLLAPDATSVPADLGTASAPPSSPSPTPTSSSNDGQAGKPVKVKSNARYGIPCVY